MLSTLITTIFGNNASYIQHFCLYLSFEGILPDSLLHYKERYSIIVKLMAIYIPLFEYIFIYF